MKKCLLLVASCLLFPITYWASPSLNGPTGLISIPTAEALKYKEFNVAFDYGMGANIQSKTSADDWSYKLNMGTFENWEIGVVGGKVPTEGMYLNVKYYLMSDDSQLPLSIAIGSENLSSMSQTNIYMIASKKMREDIGLHLGFKAIFEPEQLSPSIMGGLNYFATEELEFLGDIDGDGKTYRANLGLRYFLTNQFSFRIFILDISEQVKNSARFSIGLSFSKFL